MMKLSLIITAVVVCGYFIFSSLYQRIHNAQSMGQAMRSLNSYTEAYRNVVTVEAQADWPKGTYHAQQTINSLLQAGAIAEAGFVTILVLSPLLFGLRRAIV